MLKDKSCYVNEDGYARAFFLHNSEVRDYLIDPIVGSFIRVIIPAKDQPSTNKWYSRPQFMFMGRYTHSRFYEVTDAGEFEKIFEQMKNHIRGTEITYSNERFSKDIECTSYGLIRFKDSRMKFNVLVSSPPGIVKDDGFLTPKRRKKIIGNVVDAFRRIQNNELPHEDILTLENEMMTTIHRRDAGVRTPIVISGRKHPKRTDHFIVIGTNHANTLQRIIFLQSGNVSAEDTISKYMSKIEELSEEVIFTQNTDGCFALINDLDVNMEYVSVRLVDYSDVGKVPYVILNSDRYPANTKISYHYSHGFHQELKAKLVSFAKQFAKM